MSNGSLRSRLDPTIRRCAIHFLRFSLVHSLRRLTKRLLPSSLLHTWRDLQYTDLPSTVSNAGDPFRINIIKSHYLPKRRIYFFPEQPLPGSVAYEGSEAHRGAVAYKLCRLLGYGITTNAPHRYEMDVPGRYDVAFKYERATYLSSPAQTQHDPRHVINGTCTDVSKQAVNTAFEEVFGYSLGVDPTSYDGAMVIKSNVNAAHDGQLIHGPLAPADIEAGHAYQKVVDNTVDDGESVVDYRIPIHGDNIPLVYLKYRPTESRFDSKSAHTVLESPPAVFSDEELDQILQLANYMGVDFGELDVLRDKDEGRIYVVDVNPTPWGPPRGLTEAKRKQALLRLRDTFDPLIHQYLLR